MSDEERARILRMVAEGKLSPEEAAELLEAVQPVSREERRAQSPFPQSPVAPVGPRRRSRIVVIQVKEGGESKVNLRIPLSLTRMAGKFIPRQAQAHLASYEINLQELLEELVDADSGTILEVKDGESKVFIGVE